MDAAQLASGGRNQIERYGRVMGTPTTAGRPSDTKAYQKHWRIERARGIKRTTGVDRAAAHVRFLIEEHGFSNRAIAEAAGVGASIVCHLRDGSKHHLMRATETAILGVTPESIRARPNAEGFVPNVGARRRIRALMAMGWRHQDLSKLLGSPTHNVLSQSGDWITRQRHDAIKELYDALWDQRGPAPKTSIIRIANAGFAPPMAWDDETIDDPKAVPAATVSAQATGSRAYRSTAATAEDAEFLVRSGEDLEAVAARLDMTAATLERALLRHGRSDLVNRAKTMAEHRSTRYAS